MPVWPPTRALTATHGATSTRDALKALILAVFGALTTEQVVARLDEAQIANARMNDMAGLWAHPQLKARDRWVGVGSPAGDIPALLPARAQQRF
jgi:itaconate CoA-transferase